MLIESSSLQGRLPLNHGPIDQALQLGLRDCLRSLQTTSPGLLLTPAQLRTAEREVRYMPAMASAVSGIICRMADTNLQQKLIGTIHGWKCEAQGKALAESRDSQPMSLDKALIVAVIEQRLKDSVRKKQQSMQQSMQQSKRKRRKQKVSDEEQEYSDLDRSDNENEDEKSSESPSEHPSPIKRVTSDSQSISFWEASDAPTLTQKSGRTQGGGSPRKVAAPNFENENNDEDEWW
jgi:hypothetical protein